MPNGINNSRVKIAAKWVSIIGASHRPAKKPMITVGKASMISILGLTTLRMRESMNCEV